MEGPASAADQSDPCAICLSGMGAGGGQAIFTAECSHTFHFQCISASVAHGNHVCPLCNAQWRELPFLRPTQPRREPMHRVQPPPPQRPRLQPMHGVQQAPLQPAVEREAFDDDEPVAEASAGHDNQAEATPTPGGTGTVVVRTHTEYAALARGSPHENFAALVHVKAPGMTGGSDAQRAPLDLVTVLDVSGSMSGEKLRLVQQAMGFVIDNLGPRDRLCVVSFSSGAQRVTRLLRMSEAGKNTAKSAVEALVARGGTNIAEGLRVAARVLGERRHRNAVSSVILLSDGQDNHTMLMRQRASQHHGPAPNYEALVPAPFTRADGGDWAAPIHTFGFGSDHDAAAMHVVAEATGGTFSFIEDEAVVQDSFAQCIGGLLTVVVQDARVSIACGHPGVRVTSVEAGRYESRVDEDGRAASVHVGELYADEERWFLLFLAVPPVDENGAETEPATTTTSTLITVSCSYRDAVGGTEVTVTAEDAVVTRPEQVVDAERSVEVVRERVRVEATEDIAAARAAAERGAYQEAVDILESRQRAVAESEAALGGDPATASLQALGRELQEMRARVSSREEYARSGRAFVLAGFNMHSAQRATSREMLRSSQGPVPAEGSAAWEAPSYATKAMRAMLLRSRMSRGTAAPQQANAGEETGSSAP